MKIKFKNILEKILKERKLTAASLAQELGIPRSTVHSWISGVVPGSTHLEHLHALSKLTGYSLEYLLFGEESSNEATLFTSTFVDGKAQYRIKISRNKIETE